MERWHGRCEPCGQVGFAADDLLGLDGWLTRRARRMATLAGVNDPFRKAEQVLDIYHAVEHLAVIGRAAVGDGEALTAWLEPGRRRLLADGYLGVCEIVAAPLADAEAQKRVSEVAGGVLNYFAGHQGRLGYALRLHRGQSIGSGLVEGTIKELVNVRMKRTGARWQTAQVGRFVEFLALARSPEWPEYWNTQAA